jgi:hypothetical protein
MAVVRMKIHCLLHRHSILAHLQYLLTGHWLICCAPIAGIYMLGPQNNSRIFSNYVHDQLDGGVTGALYPDQGSAYSHWYSNVVERTHGATWLHIWTRNIHDINVSGNFADTAAIHNSGSRCVVTDTTVYAPGNRIAASQAIVDAAGPTQSSWRSRESSPSS